jgi:hypothetical protein
MRTTAARIGIAAGALAAVVALFVVFSGGDDEEGTSFETTRPQRQKTTERQRPKPKAPTIERIVVRGGKPVGGIERLEYERGERVRFSVRSDVAEEVHVHGFDVKRDVPAGGSVRFGFPADLEGVFEVELEHSHVQIAELRVTP